MKASTSPRFQSTVCCSSKWRMAASGAICVHDDDAIVSVRTSKQENRHIPHNTVRRKKKESLHGRSAVQRSSHGNVFERAQRRDLPSLFPPALYNEECPLRELSKLSVPMTA